MGKKDDLKDALKSYSSIGPKGISNLKEQFGIKGGIRSAAKDLGVNIRSGGGDSRSGGGGSSSPFEFSFPAAEGFTPAEFDAQSTLNLVNSQGNIDTQIANINSQASRYIAELQTGASKDVANIQAGATRYVANIQAGATRYVADRELEGALGTEKIRAKGAIDLQKIVNAGLKNVENIRGRYTIKGKKIDRSTAILAGLVNAFNFS